MIYSDKTVDENYISYFWKTKIEIDKEREEQDIKWEIERKTKELEALKKIPEWIERWNKLIEASLQDEWGKIVPIRAGDLYNWMELDSTLNIIEMILNWSNIDDVKKQLDSEWHSWMSYWLVCKMVFHFGNTECKRIIEELYKD
jgi:hypothetical protein